MSDFLSLPSLREIIDSHDLRAKKSLGQNFLLDLNVTDKIARQVQNIEQTTIFEIGPGPGGLTRSLLKAGAKKVIAVEFDPRAVQALESLKESAQGRLEIHQADALHTNLKDLVVHDSSETPYAIVANLPYNIATPLLLGWLKQIHAHSNAYTHMILMFQKEVAQRITAPPKNKAYGRLSVMSQWVCACTPLFDLPPHVFSPPPKVTSSVVRFTPKQNLSLCAFPVMERLVKDAFSQRRKMIRSTLKRYEKECKLSDINTALRAEDLTVEDYICLAQNVMKWDT